MLITAQTIQSQFPPAERISRIELRDVLTDYFGLHHGTKPQRHADPRALESWRDWRSLSDIAQRAGLTATSGEFLAAVADSQREILLSSYNANVTDISRLVETIEVRNFKKTELPVLSDSAEIPEMQGEDGDISPLRMTISESPASGQLREFLAVFRVSRTVWESIGEQLIRSIRAFGQKFALLEAKLLAETIEAATLTPVSGSMDATGLAAGLAALRDSLNDAGQKTNLAAYTLLVPTATEYAARVLKRNADLDGMEVVTNPYLTSGRFYLVANPQLSPALVRLRLRGSTGPRIGMQFGFERNPEFFIGLDTSFVHTGAPGLVEVAV